MNLSVKVEADIFKKFLAEAPENIEIAMVNSIRRITLLIERGAKRLAPVDTGRLRSSIANDIRPMYSVVETHTNYARFVHDGTRYMSARPFMKDAVEEVEPQVQEIIGKEIERVLK